MKGALEQKDDGCVIHLRVSFGRKRRFPAGFDPWRNRIGIEVDVEPVRGRANRQVLRLVGAVLALSEKDVKLAYGHTSREKGVFVAAGCLQVEQTLRDHGL
jgi:uncharacterized protein (TIGR00251 family)